MANECSSLDALSEFPMLGGLGELRARFSGYQLLDHWLQGELHHDLVVRVPGAARSLEFSATTLPLISGRRTAHWFDPCDLLRADSAVNIGRNLVWRRLAAT